MSEDAHIPVISQEKPQGRPYVSPRISDLPSFLLPQAKPGDFFVCLDETDDIFHEDDIVMVRRETDPGKIPDNSISVITQDGVIVFTRTSEVGSDLLGYVVWFSRCAPIS